MKITLRMLGDLRHFLPAGGDYDRVELELETASSLQDLRARLTALPARQPFFLMLNQAMVQADDFAATVLQAGDEVVLFAPIKGG